MPELLWLIVIAIAIVVITGTVFVLFPMAMTYVGIAVMAFFLLFWPVWGLYNLIRGWPMPWTIEWHYFKRARAKEKAKK